MDNFRRFLNPHVFLALLTYLKVDSPSVDKALLQTRLYARLSKFNMEQRIQQQQIQDNLDQKLIDAEPLLDLLLKKGTQKQIQDYISDNLWLVEQCYQVVVILFDLGQYERVAQIVEKLSPFIEFNEKFTHLRNGFLWAKLNTKLIKIFDAECIDRPKRIAQALDDIRELGKFDEITPKNFKIRADLLHIGTLLAFQSEEYSTYLELFSHEAYIEVVHTIAPYLHYYMTIALLFHKGQPTGVLTLQNIASLAPTNQLSKFIIQVVGKFDFSSANDLIPLVGAEAKQDLLVAQYADNLVYTCRIYFFSIYQKIFNSISIVQFSKYLNCSIEEAEIWLVNAIRQLKISAKIENGVIKVQRHEANSQNDQILHSLRELIPKNNMLASNLQRLVTVSK